MRLAFIDAEWAHRFVRTLCRVIQVSKSGYCVFRADLGADSGRIWALIPG